MSITIIHHKAPLANTWQDASPSSVIARLDAVLYNKRTTPGNGGIGKGGLPNNTDNWGAYTRGAPSLNVAAPLSLRQPPPRRLPRQADGMDVWGGGVVTDIASYAVLASETYYKDYVDTSSNGSKGLRGLPWPDCARWFSIGECENGHRFVKVRLCGKEWCPVCGAKDSWIHFRRFSRWLVKAQQMRDMGYFVVEWPLASRHELRSKQAMVDMGKRVKGAFQALGFDRGLRRWHFFGECGDKFNPHINVLVDGAYLSKRCLMGIKVYLRTVLDEPNLIVNYSYRQTIAQKVHTLKYVTRSTFLDLNWDPLLADDLYGFQNTNYWGKWKDDPAWQMDGGRKGVGDLVALESGMCCHCGTPIRWDGRVLSIVWLQMWEAAGMMQAVGGGYFEFVDSG